MVLGVIGQAVGSGWYQMLNVYGASLALLAILLVGTTWFTGLSWINAIELIGFYTLFVVNYVTKILQKAGLLIKSQIDKNKTKRQQRFLMHLVRNLHLNYLNPK